MSTAHVSKITHFVEYKKELNIKRGKYLILGLLAIIIGSLLIFNPGSAIYTYLKVTGAYLILVAMLYAYTFIKSFKDKKIK